MTASVSLTPATSPDAAAIAMLHAQSWRSAYRGLLADEYLDDHVLHDRTSFWSNRFSAPKPERRLVLKALRESILLGFVCVLLDEEPAWGARLDNLHVHPGLKGTGIGYALFQAAREWTAQMMPDGPMHLWCVERNLVARRFYDRQGGRVVESVMRPVAQGLCLPELRYLWPPLAKS
ncbi:MAG TPA: GNAT family N-acetyltransferase [Steroidobacteraceae bacterium]|jgi:GNAT superfamily N-acetyltransferase|nr:GNAT family N-acetyltransferase [Steroidobacteraceae bacterium]